MADHGISDWTVVEKYQIGYVAEPLEGDERFKGMLAIPYLTPNGVIAMKYRRLEGNGGKYAQPHGQKPRLYNTLAYFAADHIIGLAEGEVDAITATEYVGIPTVGIPGSDTWQAQAETWPLAFKDFRLVLVFTDGDSSGDKLGEAVGTTLGHRARIVRADDGEDVSSMVKAGTHRRLYQLPREQ